MANGNNRLITLISAGLPKVSDGISVPVEWIPRLQAGMPAVLYEREIIIGDNVHSFIPDTEWNGRIERYKEKPDVQAFLDMTAELQTGLDQLPHERRKRAEAALCSDNWSDLIGLGCGLTPSYDDACVGMLAVYRAFGAEVNAGSPDLSRTTDVSAKYLQLALEGYFGQVVCEVIDGLYGRGDLNAAIANIQKVGATSGKDMLRGMAIACKALYC